MSKLLTEYLERPKLVSIYRHAGGYREVEVAGKRLYHVLFSRGGAKFREVLLTEDEVACFVDVDREKLESDLRLELGHYQVSSFHYPIGVKPIDVQLMALGEGYNCNWSSASYEGCHVGWINHDLQIVALLNDEDFALRRLPLIEVEYGGFKYEGLQDDYVLSRTGGVWLGAGKPAIQTVDAAKQLSLEVLDYFKEPSGRYSREHDLAELSESVLLPLT